MWRAFALLATKYNLWSIENLQGVDLVFSPLLKAQKNLCHAFTTRKGGNSPEPYGAFNLGTLVGGESGRADALNNRENLRRILALSDSKIAVAGQVHSANVEILDDPDNLPILKEVDGLVTAKPKLTLMLHFADCVPVIVYDKNKNIAGIFHAGWRGTAQEIVVRGVEAMNRQYGCHTGDMIAAIGPAIGTCCYPVQEDALQKLSNTVQDPESLIERREVDSSARPDLKGINARQLLQLGVKEVDICAWCTSCSHDVFYSHRASGGTTGRQAALVHLN